jgi:pimeloyl-ACP methyl ester carboxylesterase
LIYIFIFILYLNRAGKRTATSLNKRPNFSKLAKVIIIPRAGHQMMIDNPDGFHDAVEEALEDHEE